MLITTALFGDRIAREGELRLGCTAVIFDSVHKAVLLTRRTDNGQWCLPGGRAEPGETVAEACAREVREETGLLVEIEHLVGIYSDPNRLVVYPDGNKVHVVALTFQARITGGELGGSDETTAWGFFKLEDIEKLDMLPGHFERINDAFSGKAGLIK